MPLRETSSAEAELIVAGPLHNNEPTAAEVIGYVDEFPIEGVRTYQVPHEAPPGVRFLGTRELGSHFPGDEFSTDPEDRVAAKVYAELQPVKHWLGIDIHDSPIPNANYLAVRHITSPEQLALACVLKLDKVQVDYGYPFFESFPKFVSVETTRDPDNNLWSQPEYWHRRIKHIASLGADGLRRLFAERQQNLTYYSKIGIPLVGRSALPMEYAKKLEDISPDGETFSTFDEVAIPVEVAKHLGVQGRRTYIGTWNHDNNSRHRPDLGVTHEGVPRRECFGSIFVEVAPPIVTGERTLEFLSK